jgi:hypothetical protein
MAQHENPDPKNPAEEPAIARQAKAIEKIDRLVKGDEPIGEKLKDAVDEHSQACDDLKQELGSHKQETPSPYMEPEE